MICPYCGETITDQDAWLPHLQTHRGPAALTADETVPAASTPVRTLVNYDPGTGEIVGLQQGVFAELPPPPPGMSQLEIANIDPTVHVAQFHNLYHVVSGALTAFTTSECADRNKPIVFEVRQAIEAELAETDRYMMPDFEIHQVPISDEDRLLWVNYRKMLRRLSNQQPDACAMCFGWTLRPDGLDPIAHLRARIPAP